VKHCLSVLDRLRGACSDPNAVEMAVWFHDAVYDPRAKDNEERSADLARQVLDVGGFRPAFIDRVTELVLTTRHDAPPVGKDAEVLADVDLAILGETEGAFADYEDGIRAEYAFMSESRFVAGRIRVLERFSERPRIYATVTMRPREAAARKNIRRSLARLYTKVLPIGSA
jgi:predicted metal-dependent HD superfamily phosphohydrolase